MTPEGDHPSVGRSARQLGVRVPPHEVPDVRPGAGGDLLPGKEGMSVSPSLQALPFTRVPARLREWVPGARGRDEDRVFRYGDGTFVRQPLNAQLRQRLWLPRDLRGSTWGTSRTH